MSRCSASSSSHGTTASQTGQRLRARRQRSRGTRPSERRAVGASDGANMSWVDDATVVLRRHVEETLAGPSSRKPKLPRGAMQQVVSGSQRAPPVTALRSPCPSARVRCSPWLRHPRTSVSSSGTWGREASIAKARGTSDSFAATSDRSTGNECFVHTNCILRSGRLRMLPWSRAPPAEAVLATRDGAKRFPTAGLRSAWQ